MQVVLPQLIVALLGLLLIVLAVRLAQHVITRNLRDSDSRYYGRKLITFGGYLGPPEKGKPYLSG